MRIVNRTHVPWFIFVIVATLFAIWLHVGNFSPQSLPDAFRLPGSLLQKPSESHRVGGTPLGLIFGTIALAIFIFAALLGVRKKVVLWRIGTVQRWLRAHIWLTLLTIPLVILHSGFRLGGPMTTLIIVLYVIVMVSGICGMVLQHYLPAAMMERLPAESVYEQIPHIRAQLVAAATKMRDTFKPAPPTKQDAGAPAPSAEKTVTTGTAAMASTSAELSTPTARAKTVVGSAITAETVALPEKKPAPASATPNPSAAATPSPPKPAPPPKPAAPTTDADSEAALLELLDRQVLPYLSARRGDRMRLGNARFSEDTFRFVKLRVTEAYRDRVEEMQSWCDERRMLDLQLKLQHWLHSWLFVHAPVSFLLLMLVFWHAFVTLFKY
ncbi:MAG TPA: hypothetical protein VNX27_12695 [Chthoniobacterales bacterium]|jgi:hypothetical protein|nr:hypothetical protein [Chthoniobacterales bacterium]